MGLRPAFVASAISIALLVAAFPAFAGAGSATIVFMDIADGAHLRDLTFARLRLTNANGTWAGGYLTIDGQWAGNLSVAAHWSHNETWILVGQVRTSGFPDGTHTLSANVTTDVEWWVWEPALRVEIDRPPSLVLLDSHFDHHLRRVVANVTAWDGGQDMTVTLASLGANSTATFNGTRELALPLDPPPGWHDAYVQAIDARGQSAWASFSYRVENTPTWFQSVEATYVIPDALFVRAQLSDHEGVRNVSVTTPLGGGALSYDHVNGTWRASLPVQGRIGTFTGTITARDMYGGNTSTNFSFTIGGPREVLFERTIVTGTGIHVDALDQYAFPRMHDVLIEICVEDCSGNTTYLGTTILVTANEGGTADPEGHRCANPVTLGSDCAFDIVNTGNWFLEVHWKQIGQIEATVRVTGVRV